VPWFKVDDGFHGHPKVVELSLASVGLWTLAGSWCAKYLTNGAVRHKTIVRLGGDAELASELVDADLWQRAGDGYQFKDWEHYQPLKEDVEAERLAAQERMRKVRAAKKGVKRSPEQEANIERSSEEVRIAPSQSQSHPSPDPTPKGVVGRKKPEAPLPDDWTPKPSHVKYAADNGIDGRHEEAQFRAHAAANDRRQRDWDAAFRGWLGNAVKWSKDAPSKRSGADGRFAATLALADGLKEIEQ
jgi:hypothetical protein